MSDEVRYLYDSVYGLISFDMPYWNFIDTPQFQRLREIKQLGTAYFVYPGASHNRFEHCLGTGHLAKKVMNHIRKSQPSLEVLDSDIFNVTLAGIMHDVGHGPYSHCLDYISKRLL
mmetsp:Transcript_26314/g.47184  ORF Transcript_26314/g.47184 Transcript_26314/m.47184 type:complete len:116 (-) Transcript_26314:3403-3750(-)